MKPVFLIIALLLLLLLKAYSQEEAMHLDRNMEIRVFFDNTSEADKLNRLGMSGDIYLHSGYGMFHVSPEETELLKSLGFRFDVIKDDIAAFAKSFWETRDQYHSYEEIIYVIDSLSFNYPGICKKVSYGTSVEGRQLAALRISDNVDNNETEPGVMFDGGIHGDEIGGAENLIRFAEFLCDNYNSDPGITALINEREIWLYIMVNPDGRVNMTRYNSFGVDLNRDWGYMWAGDGASPGYYSQVETRAIRSCLLENQVVIHTSYHSGTEFLAYPWSYRPDPCPDQAHIHQLAGIYASTSGYTDLPYEQGYTGMYAINGSSKDAGYATMGAVSWTMEISEDKQPAPSEIQHFYDINKPAMIEMIEYAGYGLGGTIADAVSGEPVAATIFVNDFYPCYTDPVNGDYHKYLLAGSYEVTAVANGYQSMTQTAVVINNNFTGLNFALQPADAHFAYRVIACELPYENFADESLTSEALRAPDGINYSLGKSGWIILDMQQEIIDGPADEIVVHEGDSDPESYSCYASESMDGPWTLLGGGTGTSPFDFSPAGLMAARYIKITDGGNGPLSGNNTGFDLDAIEVPEQPQVIFLAPDVQILDPAGNENGRIDPGETFDMVITLHNLGGVTLENGLAWLNIDDQYLSCSNPELAIESLAFGDSIQLVFPMGCSSFAPTGELLMTVLNIISNDGAYMECFPLNFTSSTIVEDWETANLLKFDWSVSGNKPWAINFSNPYQGAYSAKSGNIDNGEVSSLEVTMDVIGYDDISFYCKVSSETGGDFLKFYIDNNIKGEWSGERPWEYQTYQVKPGVHTFKWLFVKDNATTTGLDAGWTDYIVFPSCNLDGSLKVLANAIPRHICGSGESQLGAYILGGNGATSYQWEPTSTLNDPAIQFPLAVPEATTIYTVTVSNDQDTVSSSTEVTFGIVPDPAIIVQAGDSLISSAEEGNNWHNSLGPIEGATGKVYYPGVEDAYYSLVTEASGCTSDTSNIVNFIFTGVADNPAYPSFIKYTNPVHDNLDIHFLQKPTSDINIFIIDITGRPVTQLKGPEADFHTIIRISTIDLRNGLFLLNISDSEGRVLLSGKFIKL